MVNSISFEQLNALTNEIKRTNQKISTLIDSGGVEKNIVNLGGFPAIQFSNTVDSGKTGCFIFEFLGLPIQLCWDFELFEVTDEKADVKVKFTTGFKGETWLTRTLAISCNDPLNTSPHCKAQIESETYHIEAFSPSCKWGKLAICSAPCALQCGKGYACWAICAGSCVLKHCSIW